MHIIPGVVGFVREIADHLPEVPGDRVVEGQDGGLGGGLVLYKGLNHPEVEVMAVRVEVDGVLDLVALVREDDAQLANT